MNRNWYNKIQYNIYRLNTIYIDSAKFVYISDKYILCNKYIFCVYRNVFQVMKYLFVIE